MILNNKHANCVHRHVHYTLVCNLNVLINYGLLRQEKTKQYKQHRPIFVKIENCSHVLLREHNPILVYIYTNEGKMGFIPTFRFLCTLFCTISIIIIFNQKKETVSPGWCGSIGWSVIPWTERSQVQFLVRAHTQAACFIPGWGWGMYKKATDLSPSLSSFLLSLKAMKKKCPGVRIKTERRENEKAILHPNERTSSLGNNVAFHI